MTTIYVFCNGCDSEDWHAAMAMADDGEVVHQHICSNHSWMEEDCVRRQTDRYNEKYPGGWMAEIILGNPKEHAGVMAAYARNQERRRALEVKL